jgi:hypothetical protein
VQRGLLGACALALALASPAAASTFTFSPLQPVSPTNGVSPYGSTSAGAACQGAAQPASSVNYPGTAVEPMVTVDPGNPQVMIGAWQQDRWNDGGAVGLKHAYSTDGGATWQPSSNNPAFSNCDGPAGLERATDPWVAIQPDGTAWSFGLGINGTDATSAMMVSSSTDHGATWGPTQTLRKDTAPTTLNDKNSITADPYANGYVYAVWDRLVFPNAHASASASEHAIGYRGPTWFSRKTPTGAFEAGRMIYDPGAVNQTIGNQIVVLRDGTLVDAFDLIFNASNSHKTRGYNVAFLTSGDKGATWSSKPEIVSNFRPGVIDDPTDGHAVRTGDIIPEVAADPTSDAAFYLVWQDARFGSAGSAVVYSRVERDAAGAWTSTAPQVVNTNTATQAFTPSIRVRDDGTVAVTYYDFREDSSTAPLDTDMWAIHSHDRGQTWVDEQKLSGPFDMAGAAVARGYFVGDYEGLGEDGQRFVPFFSQVTTGTNVHQESDIEETEGG